MIYDKINILSIKLERQVLDNNVLENNWKTDGISFQWISDSSCQYLEFNQNSNNHFDTTKT